MTLLAASYLSADEVNQSHARSLGSMCGIDVSIVRPHDCPDTLSRPVLVCDFDSIPEGDKPTNMESLIALAARTTIVLHSYQLDDEEVAVLRAQGFIIRRYLDRKLFKDIKQLNNAA